MRLHAFLRENVVVKVESIDEAQYAEQIKDYQNIIDVQDLLITPSVGYILSGNQLVPGVGQSVSVKQMIIAKLTNYQAVAPALLKDLYADNTLMGITAAQSDAMFDEYQDVIVRLSQGAFPTAIYRLQQKTPSGFVTQELIDNWIIRIQVYL
jgi:hypothetical protein